MYEIKEMLNKQMPKHHYEPDFIHLFIYLFVLSHHFPFQMCHTSAFLNADGAFKYRNFGSQRVPTRSRAKIHKGINSCINFYLEESLLVCCCPLYAHGDGVTIPFTLSCAAVFSRCFLYLFRGHTRMKCYDLPLLSNLGQLHVAGQHKMLHFPLSLIPNIEILKSPTVEIND